MIVNHHVDTRKQAWVLWVHWATSIQPYFFLNHFKLCVYAQCECQCPWSPEEGIVSSEAEVTGGSEPSDVGAELNSDPLQKQCVLALEPPL